MAPGTDAPLSEVSRLIQLAVAPVFLLTAIGAILNVLTSRLARIIDRIRMLEETPLAELPMDEALRDAELHALDRRLHATYIAISLSVLSALGVGLLIAVAFIDAFLAPDLSRLVGAIFLVTIVLFLLALMMFLREIFLAISWARGRPERRKLLGPPAR